MCLINLKLNLTKWHNEKGKHGDNFEGQTYRYDNDDDVDDDCDDDNDDDDDNNNDNNNT